LGFFGRVGDDDSGGIVVSVDAEVVAVSMVVTGPVVEVNRGTVSRSPIVIDGARYGSRLGWVVIVTPKGID